MTSPIPQQPANADAPDNAAEQRKLFRIATAQRILLWAVLSQFLLLLPRTAATEFVILFVALFSLIAVFRLAKAMQNRWAWLLIIASVVPYLGFLTLLFVNIAATKYLQRAGIAVGLMGASRTAIKHLAASQ